jgi:outer membrane protein OmpA-like peptidoglycan-associated protein
MEDLFGVHQKARRQDSEHWISLSDLMAGLMMVFLVISVAFMRYVQIERDKIKEVAIAYQNSQVALYEELKREFSEDLPVWDAEIEQSTLEFRFKSPDVLFENAAIELRPQFQLILDDFFPRYLRVLKRFDEHIQEIRIEGHTSSLWAGATSLEEAYFNNMELSQGRTRSVLHHIYTMQSVSDEKHWLREKFASIGYSSAHPVLKEDGSEDSSRSRRVSFRVLTNAEIQIRRIIQE